MLVLITIGYCNRNKLSAQDCIVYTSILNQKYKVNNYNYAVFFKTREYELRFDRERIVDHLSKFFTRNIVDSLITQMSQINSHRIDKKWNCTNVSLVNSNRLEKLLKRNNKYYQNGVYPLEKKRYQLAIFYFSDIIYYQDYAIIQIDSYVSSMNTDLSMLLCKRGQDGKWTIIENLASLAS